MPIKAAQNILKIQLKAILSKGDSADADSIAVKICQAIGAAAAKGLKPIKSSPYYIPLIPTGISSASSKLKKLFKSFPEDTDQSMTQFASVISTIAPACKKTGLSSLQTQLKKACRITDNNNVDKIASDWSAAIINYYIAGGIK